MSLPELLERVKAASDRLDDATLARVLCAVQGVEYAHHGIVCGDDGSDELYVIDKRNRRVETFARGGYRDLAPDSSIDAAVALIERVLPGWRKSVVILTPEPCQAYAWHPERGTIGRVYRSSAPTAPLALISALLGAKIAEDKP
jgi:hypothetical protein